MKWRFAGVLIALVVVFMPAAASADRAQDILNEIAEIFEQIRQLQAQLDAAAGSSNTPVGTGVAPPPTPVSAPTLSQNCPAISRVLGIGSSGNDVTNLQQYLAQDRSIYPEQIVSGYYGALTEAAVKRWQARHGIVSSGSADTNGYGLVGPRTRRALANCGESIPSQVGAVLNVRPTSGAAPLKVTLSPTVNTNNSCERATYTVDFGDGTASQQVVVPAGRCTALTQDIEHTYLQPGAYTATLRIGNNRTSVTINARSFESAGSVFRGGNVTPTEGSVPLFAQAQATFDTRACAQAASSFQTFRINFGDGTTEDVYVQDQENVPADCGRRVTVARTHLYDEEGVYNVTLEEIGPSATGAQTTVDSRLLGAITVGSTTDEVIVSKTLDVSPTVGSAPHTVTARFSHGLCRDGESWRIDWGDGVGTQEAHVRQGAHVSCTALSANRVFTHIYSQAGTYMVSLFKGGGTPAQAPLVASTTVRVAR